MSTATTNAPNDHRGANGTPKPKTAARSYVVFERHTLEELVDLVDLQAPGPPVFLAMGKVDARNADEALSLYDKMSPGGSPSLAAVAEARFTEKTRDVDTKRVVTWS